MNDRHRRVVVAAAAAVLLRPPTGLDAVDVGCDARHVTRSPYCGLTPASQQQAENRRDPPLLVLRRSG
jgi:hypothetical protein